MFQLFEEVRLLTNLPPGVDLAPTETATVAAASAFEEQPGPRVVIVHGVQEGRNYPLRHTDLRRGRGWIIGRDTGAHVSLGYDPFISSENSEILKENGQFSVMDLRTARNGTWVNWKRLPVGGSAPLKSGDVVGVGRSLLIFRDS